MHSFPCIKATGPPRAASRPATGAVSPATLRIAHEADATMSPDGWEADYSEPGFLVQEPVVSPVFALAGALPTA